MKTVKLNFFWFLAFFLVAETFLATLLAISGLFNFFFFCLTTILLGLIFFWLFRRKNFQIQPLDKLSGGVLLTLFLFGGALSWFSSPTIFGGRDEGSYANSAIILANTGKLTEHSLLSATFHQIYGTGKALNFPGFNFQENGDIKSQFLPAYPVWLAIFYKIFGLTGFKLANLFPFILLVFSLFSLFRLLFLERNQKLSLKEKNLFALLPVLLTLSSLPFTIFYKFTLSEIWFASLIWLSLYITAIYFFAQRNRAIYYSALLPLLLLPLSRIEGPVIIFMLLLFFILEDSVNFKKVEYQSPFALLGGIFFLTVIWEPNFFINALKGVAEPFFSNTTLLDHSIQKNFSPDDWKNCYLAKIFFTYNLWPFWLMLGGSLFHLLRKFYHNWRTKDHLSHSLPLSPFFILLPTFFYFWDANISLDHPWMLRRFIFSLLPLAILYSAHFLLLIYSKSSRLAWFVIVTLLAVNISLFWSDKEIILINSDSEKTTNSTSSELQPLNFLTFVPQQKLLNQLLTLDKQIQPTNKDLILVSQKSSGSGWSIIAEPWRNLLGRQAIYFFNPSDLEKIDRQKFEKIFLVTSENETSLYEKIPKEKLFSYQLKNDFLLPSREPLTRPRGLMLETTGAVYLLK
mgnify:CR=1 FL=1